MKFIINLLIFLLLNTCCVKAQICYLLSDPGGQVSRVDIHNCSSSYIDACSRPDGMYYLDIALDRNNNLYYIDGITGAIVVRNLDSLDKNCTVLATFNSQLINSLVVDSVGKIYGAYDSLYVYDPVTKKASNLGSFPPGIQAYGDLTFFNGELYMATDKGIVQVNIKHPQASFLYMETSLPNAYGIITIPDNCNEFKTYITSFTDNETSLIEVDLANKKVLGVKCKLPFLTYGAASVVESGSFKKASIDSVITSATCPANNNGTIKVTASGAGILSFSLDNSDFAEKDSFNLLSAGRHAIAVLDEVGCREDTTVIIPVLSPVTYQIVTRATTCSYSQDGSASINLISGEGFFAYKINENNYTSNPDFTNLPAGQYNVSIRQDSLCYYDSSFSILAATKPQYNISTLPSCIDFYSGQAIITMTDNGENYKYQLDNNGFGSSPQFSHISSGNHVLQLQNSKGCSYDTTINISEDKLTVRAIHEDVECNHNGKITLANLSGFAPFTYQLNDMLSQSDSVFANLPVGNYTIKITDANHCTSKAFATIKVNPYPCVDSIFFPSAFTPNKDGKNDVFRPLYNKQPRFYHLVIKDRWGRTVFETYDITKGWNGLINGIEQAATTYVFFAEFSYTSMKKAGGTVVLIK